MPPQKPLSSIESRNFRKKIVIISIVAIVLILLAGYTYFYIQKQLALQNAYNQLHQAAGQAIEQYNQISQQIASSTGEQLPQNSQHIVNRIVQHEQSNNTVSTQSSLQLSAGHRTISKTNAYTKESFSITVPNSWTDDPSNDFETSDTTYISLHVPPVNQQDLTMFSLKMSAFTNDPSNIDNDLKEQIAASLHGANDLSYTLITITGADKAWMGMATQQLPSNQGTQQWFVIEAYKSGDLYGKTVEMIFSADIHSPQVPLLKQVISTLKIE